MTDKISYGTFDLSPSMDVNAIIEELSSGSQNAERTITIIPGWTVEDIADYLYEEGAIQSREEFLTLCRDAAPFADMSYPIKLAQDMGTLSGRKYQLEGYLAPDTYRVFRNASAQQIVSTLVEQTNTVIDEVYYSDHIQYEVDPETGEYREVTRYCNDDLTLDAVSYTHLDVYKRQVEDDVTAYVEYENGATGTFVTTTGDVPGSNRFEITMDKGKLVAEAGRLMLWELEIPEPEFSKTNRVAFAAPRCTYKQVETDGKSEQHSGVDVYKRQAL